MRSRFPRLQRSGLMAIYGSRATPRSRYSLIVLNQHHWLAKSPARERHRIQATRQCLTAFVLFVHPSTGFNVERQQPTLAASLPSTVNRALTAFCAAGRIDNRSSYSDDPRMGGAD